MCQLKSVHGSQLACTTRDQQPGRGSPAVL